MSRTVNLRTANIRMLVLMCSCMYPAEGEEEASEGVLRVYPVEGELGSREDLYKTWKAFTLRYLPVRLCDFAAGSCTN